MARIRTVKPEFWINEELALLPAETRLLAIGLLNHSDDEGYFRATPQILKAAIFPYSDNSTNIPRMLQELSGAGYVRLGIGEDGKQYGHVINFLRHQRVDKPKPSEIKEIIEFQEHSKNLPRTIQEPSKEEWKGMEEEREREREGNKRASARKSPKTILDYSSWPEPASDQVLTDWLAMRKQLRAEVSQTVINQFGKELHLAIQYGYTVDECLSECVTSGWRGFKFSWIKNREVSNAQRQQPARPTLMDRARQAAEEAFGTSSRIFEGSIDHAFSDGLIAESEPRGIPSLGSELE
jgi:hypothetical protein